MRRGGHVRHRISFESFKQAIIQIYVIHILSLVVEIVFLVTYNQEESLNALY